jgi:hypothetical protein
MTDTNQKLREALQAIANIDDATSHTADASAALDRIGSIVRQALALPTADHLPDDGEMVVDHFPDATKMIETAVPVGAREAFEREMSKPPFEFCMDRWPDDGSSYSWPGNYAAYHTQCAWVAWQALAALSAGDAVDAQRYRWLADCLNYPEAVTLISDGSLTAESLGKAIDAAMRKGQI